MKYSVTILLLGIALTLQAGFSERIQLFVDQESYLSGEDILVAVTTTTSDNRPVEFSKVVYVELLDSNRVHAQVMISVDNATGKGILSIPESLPTAYYRLRAYTRYMRNESQGVYTNQLVAVVNAATLHKSRVGQKEEQLLAAKTTTDKLSQNSAPDETTHGLRQAGNAMLQMSKQRFGRRERGSVSIGNLPSDAALYHISIAPDMYVSHIPSSGERVQKLPSVTKNKEPLLAEYEGHIIKARISGIKPEARAVLISVPGNPLSLMAGRKMVESDEFEFITSNLTGNIELATSIDTRGEERFTLEFLSPFAPVDTMKLPELIVDPAAIPALVERYIALQARQAFETQLYTSIQSEMPSTSTPEWTYRLEEYTRFNTVEEVILEFISNVRFRRVNGIRTLAVNREGPQGYTLGNTLVLLDNVPVFNHELLLKYDASLIDQIDVYRGQYVFGGQLYDGIVAFSSHVRDFRGFQLDRSTMITSYKGPQAGFELTSPYSLSTPKISNEPDFRTALLLESLYSAKPVQLHFVTSDLTGSYRILIRGLTTSGSQFSEMISFEVN